MKIKLFSVLIVLLLSSGAVYAGKPAVTSLKHQVIMLTEMVNAMKADLTAVRAELSATQAELAVVKNNSVLGLDGLLTLSQDANGFDTVLFSGVNVQVVNGVGTTTSVNGLGNIVIGYNASNDVFVNQLGSHNIVLGDGQSYPNTEAVVTERIISNENLELHVANNLNTVVGASQSMSVGSGSSIAVGGDRAVQIGGMSSIFVGDDVNIDIAKNMNMSIASNMILTTDKNAKISVGKEAEIDVADELLVKVGIASSMMRKNGAIDIEGKDIAIKGSGDVTIKAGKDLILKGSRILQN